MDSPTLQTSHQGEVRFLRRLTFALLLFLSGGTGATLWLLYELQKEREAISDLLRTPSSAMIDTLAPFPEELRWQFMLTVLLLCVLIASAVALVMILRGYLRSQQSLRDLVRQATEILESMEHGIITGDPDGRIIFTNREAQLMLGLDPSPNGLTLDEVDAKFPGLALGGLAIDVLNRADSGEDRAFSFVRSGHRVHLVADGHLLRDDAGMVHGTVLHLKDVTERQLIRERMQRMEGYMGLGPVAAGLQHEIKNPLGALSLHVQLLAERLSTEDDAEVKDHLGVLRTEISRIGSVLESFRDYADANVLNREHVAARQLVERAVRLVAPQAKAKGIDIRVDAAEGDGPQLEADANRVQQVLLNLFLNALEAMTGPGGIVIHVSEQDGHVRLDVADQGPGVSPAVGQNLFDPYFTTKKNGLGMGLAVCRKIARLHGGDLKYIKSSPGTLFRLSLPVAPGHATV